jgi:hypothetical protein
MKNNCQCLFRLGLAVLLLVAVGGKPIAGAGEFKLLVANIPTGKK